MANPRQRVQLVLALINLVRIANTMHKERWIPRVMMPEQQRLVPIMREPPYLLPMTVDMPQGWTGRKVAITVTMRRIIKEYEAPGYALADNLPVYEHIIRAACPTP